MPEFRKKPVQIEAIQFRGSSSQREALRHWMAGGQYREPAVATRDLGPLQIHTLEGTMTADPGDYVIRGVQGEFYPCKPDIFAQTYDPA